jgi:hypothetical protein
VAGCAVAWSDGAYSSDFARKLRRIGRKRAINSVDQHAASLGAGSLGRLKDAKRCVPEIVPFDELSASPERQRVSFPQTDDFSALYTCVKN